MIIHYRSLADTSNLLYYQNLRLTVHPTVLFQTHAQPWLRPHPHEPASPQLSVRKPNTPRELAHKGLGACSRGVVSKLTWGVGPAHPESWARGT